MSMDWFTVKFNMYSEKEAFIYKGKIYTYSWLSKQIYKFEDLLNNFSSQTVFSIHSDYNPCAIAILFALLKKKKIIVPITTSIHDELNDRLSIAQVEVAIEFKDNKPIFKILNETKPQGRLFDKISESNHAGLILFSSGSTGKPKAMVHDLNNLLEIYKDKKSKKLKFLIFLMFDHIGGLNTLLNGLSKGATLVIPEQREPDYIASLIEKYKINLLPTSPTFLRLLLVSESYKRYNLSSLKIVTYGTEPMTENLLKRLRKVFAHTRFLQTFGTSETGIAMTLSKSSQSLYMKIEDDNIQWKVVDGELWLKGKAQILGYLNYGNPFRDDGWFPTGDLVELAEDGYIKIVGRKKEIINVGGQKVLPSEVENTILELEEVNDVTVYGEHNPLIGEIVVAEIAINDDIDKDMLSNKIRLHCKEKLERYKWPVRIKIVNNSGYATQFKKKRIKFKEDAKVDG